MAYNLKWMGYDELVKEMEKVALVQTGVHMKFDFELSSDGNTDLYVSDRHRYTKNEIKILVDMGWIEESLLDEMVEKHISVTDDPFKYHDELSQSHMLFNFILENTYGIGAHVAGIDDDADCVMLNIAIPS